MIAALLVEEPQSFVPQGRPSPPIASIFGRFTADEVGAMRIVGQVLSLGVV